MVEMTFALRVDILQHRRVLRTCTVEIVNLEVSTRTIEQFRRCHIIDNSHACIPFYVCIVEAAISRGIYDLHRLFAHVAMRVYTMS